MGDNIDTQNDFFFGTNGDTMGPFLPVVITSKEQAYRTAAWIELMGSMLPAETDLTYEQVRQAIRET